MKLKIEDYVCDRCNKTFKNRTEIIKHIASEHGKKIRKQIQRYQCRYCGRTYITKMNVELHIRCHHSRENNHDAKTEIEIKRKVSEDLNVTLDNIKSEPSENVYDADIKIEKTDWEDDNCLDSSKTVDGQITITTKTEGHGKDKNSSNLLLHTEGVLDLSLSKVKTETADNVYDADIKIEQDWQDVTTDDKRLDSSQTVDKSMNGELTWGSYTTNFAEQRMYNNIPIYIFDINTNMLPPLKEHLYQNNLITETAKNAYQAGNHDLNIATAKVYAGKSLNTHTANNINYVANNHNLNTVPANHVYQVSKHCLNKILANNKNVNETSNLNLNTETSNNIYEASNNNLNTETAENVYDAEIKIEEHDFQDVTTDDSSQTEVESEAETISDSEYDSEDEYFDTMHEIVKEKGWCDFCEKKVRRFNIHMRIHTGERPFACDMCDRKYKQSNDLRRHKNTVHSKEKPYSCDICGKKYAISDYLRVHKKTHLEDKPYKCDICYKQFVTATHLKIHLRIHTGEKPYSCDICDKKFRQSGDLTKHVKLHTGEKPYSCHLCTREYTNKFCLRKHMRSHEKPNKDKEFTCKICDDETCDLRDHSKKKKYICDICNAKYYVRGSFRRHLKVHSGEKPYPCEICHKKFTESYSLKIHKRIHTGEKPYRCNECGQSFTRPSSLHKHSKVHLNK